ncbi:MAG: hypothetical protein R2762_15525 [Bryobacteraceae bacterium]
MPADPSLAAAIIDNRGDDDTASPLRKLLLGFTNTMTLAIQRQMMVVFGITRLMTAPKT